MRFAASDPRKWNKPKHRAASSDARVLWDYFLSSEPTISIPGVVVGGVAAHAERLCWAVQRFHDAYAELIELGFHVEADFDARLTWLPMAIQRYQRPNKASQILGWSRHWDAVPDCPVKYDLWEAIRDVTRPFEGQRVNNSKVTLKTFEELFREPPSGPSALPARYQHGASAVQGSGIRDQGSENKSSSTQSCASADAPAGPGAGLFGDSDGAPSTQKAGKGSRKPATPRKADTTPTGHAECIAAFTDGYSKIHGGAKPTWNAHQGRRLKELLAAHDQAEVRRRMAIFFGPDRPAFPADFDFGAFAQFFDRYAAPTKRATNTGSALPSADHGVGEIDTSAYGGSR